MLQKQFRAGQKEPARLGRCLGTNKAVFGDILGGGGMGESHKDPGVKPLRQVEAHLSQAGRGCARRHLVVW